MYEKWKKQFAKDMKGVTSVQFDGSAWLTWKKVVMLDLEPTGMSYLLETGKQAKNSGLMSARESIADTLFQRYLLGRLTDTPRRVVTVCSDTFEKGVRKRYCDNAKHYERRVGGIEPRIYSDSSGVYSEFGLSGYEHGCSHNRSG